VIPASVFIHGMKTQINRLLNLVLYLTCCAGAGTGLVLAFRLPPRSRGGDRLELLGLDRHQWGDIHFALALIVIGLTVVHLALHRKWLIKVAASRHLWHLAGGLLLGLGLVGLAFILPTQVASGGRW